MARGRKPLPTNLKINKGTARKDRTNKAEPKPKADSIKAPTYLSPVARAQWDAVVKKLKDAGILANTDVEALALYCCAFADWRAYCEEIERSGMIIYTGEGYPVTNPAVAQARNAFEQMRKLLPEFGMTPSSRAKIVSTKKPDDGDEWGDF